MSQRPYILLTFKLLSPSSLPRHLPSSFFLLDVALCSLLYVAVFVAPMNFNLNVPSNYLFSGVSLPGARATVISCGPGSYRDVGEQVVRSHRYTVGTVGG